jgi:hypothetical protein
MLSMSDFIRSSSATPAGLSIALSWGVFERLLPSAPSAKRSARLGSTLDALSSCALVGGVLEGIGAGTEDAVIGGVNESACPVGGETTNADLLNSCSDLIDEDGDSCPRLTWQNSSFH